MVVFDLDGSPTVPVNTRGQLQMAMRVLLDVSPEQEERPPWMAAFFLSRLHASDAI